MKLPFDQQPEAGIPQFKGGEGVTYAKMFNDERNRILCGRLEPGSTIGLHTHESGSEIIYILSGTATVLYDDEVEMLTAGQCHYCPKGHSHSLQNRSDADLTFFAVVPNQ